MAGVNYRQLANQITERLDLVPKPDSPELHNEDRCDGDCDQSPSVNSMSPMLTPRADQLH